MRYIVYGFAHGLPAHEWLFRSDPFDTLPEAKTFASGLSMGFDLCNEDMQAMILSEDDPEPEKYDASKDLTEK